MEQENHHCRVCGLYLTSLPWGDDDVTPSYEICSCCGVEFGYEDYTVESAVRYRDHWLANGAKWFAPQDQPNNWDLFEQISCVPNEFK